MDYRRIIKKIVVTEKASTFLEKDNRYVFEITRSATKGQVKNAVEKVFGVKVLDVHTLQNRGKLKRNLTVRRRAFYKSPDVKKAIVKIDAKDSIKLFDSKDKKSQVK